MASTKGKAKKRKLTGSAKAAFLHRMARGRNKGIKKNPKRAARRVRRAERKVARRTARRVVRRNPLIPAVSRRLPAVAKKRVRKAKSIKKNPRRVRRAVRRVARRTARRVIRRNPIGAPGSFFEGIAEPVLIGGAGAVGASIFMGMVGPSLPASFQTGLPSQIAKAGIIVALGLMGERLFGEDTAQKATIGALTVVAYNTFIGLLATAAPNLTLGRQLRGQLQGRRWGAHPPRPVAGPGMGGMQRNALRPANVFRTPTLGHQLAGLPGPMVNPNAISSPNMGALPANHPQARRMRRGFR